MNNKKIKMIIIMLLMVVIIPIGVLAIGNFRKNNVSPKEKVYMALISLINLQEKEKNELVRIEENVNGISDISEYEISTYQKNNKYLKKVNYVEESSDILIGELYLDNEKIRIISPKDEAAYIKYSDIFSIIEKILPTRIEEIKNLEGIQYDKYFKIIDNAVKVKLKNKFLEEKYIVMFDELLEQSILNEEESVVTIDGKNINTTQIKIVIPEQKILDVQSKVLVELKNDDKIYLILNEVIDEFDKVIVKTKDYEKIGYTEEQYIAFKENVKNNLKEQVKKYIENYLKSIDLNSKIKNDREISIVLNVDNNNELVRSYIETNYKIADETADYDMNITKITVYKDKVDDSIFEPKHEKIVNVGALDSLELKVFFNIMIKQYNKLVSDLYTSHVEAIQ